MMQKRTALKLVLAGAAAAMLAGCGDKTEAPKEAAAPEKTAAAPADKAAGPYKVAFVYVSPASEEGWSVSTTSPVSRSKRYMATK